MNLDNKNTGAYAIVILMSAVPFFGMLSMRVLPIVYALLAFVVVIKEFECNKNYLKTIQIKFLLVSAVLVLINLIPLSGMLLPISVIIGSYIRSSFNWRLSRLRLINYLNIALIFYGYVHNLDPNFMSFYIAILIAISTANIGKADRVAQNAFVILIVAVCVYLFGSRAFLYASVVYVSYLTIGRKGFYESLNIKYVFVAMFITSILVTYIVTIGDGGVYYLYRELEVSDSKEIKLLDKISNWQDLNRFRITKMWINDYLIEDARVFLFGLGGEYVRIANDKGYYLVHNSFVEILLYFGVVYALIFFISMWKTLRTESFNIIPLAYVLSFGMVLHGVFYYCVIPLYYIIVGLSGRAVDGDIESGK